MCPLGRPAGEDGTFLKGTIEQVPLPDTSVDIAISGCVINLAEDQGAVLHEAFRVLKPGGRFTFRQEHAGTPAADQARWSSGRHARGGDPACARVGDEARPVRPLVAGYRLPALRRSRSRSRSPPRPTKFPNRR